MYHLAICGTWIPVGWNKPLLTLMGGAKASDHVQLDAVVDDLSRNFGSNCADQPFNCGGPEFLHCAAFYAH